MMSTKTEIEELKKRIAEFERRPIWGYPYYIPVPYYPAPYTPVYPYSAPDWITTRTGFANTAQVSFSGYVPTGYSITVS
jgi:hypothetical protein